MLLMDFVKVYVSCRDLRGESPDQLRYSAVSLVKHAGPVETSQLSDDLVNDWIAARLKAGLSRATVHRQRGSLLCLWRDAHRRGIAPPIGSVRQVRLANPAPVAWLPAEFEKLLAAIDRLPGAWECGIPRRVAMRAIILVGYYTGLRPSDLLALRSDDVLAGGTIVIRQSKTGHPIKLSLPQDAIDAVLATRPEQRELVFPLHRKRLAAWMRRLRQLAGVRGSAKWLRRTGATRCEQQRPGSAMSYLGHKTPGLAYKHYVDLRQVGEAKAMPPAI